MIAVDTLLAFWFDKGRFGILLVQIIFIFFCFLIQIETVDKNYAWKIWASYYSARNLLLYSS